VGGRRRETSVERAPPGEVAGLGYRCPEISMDSATAAGKTPVATDLSFFSKDVATDLELHREGNM
jgi:hypothetical protein